MSPRRANSLTTTTRPMPARLCRSWDFSSRSSWPWAAVVAAMNTLYAAVSRRAMEIGTLRVLGFSRFSILASFFCESLLLAGIGGLLGCLLALPLNGMTTGVGSFTTFSEIAFNFRVTPSVMLPGVIFALILGAVG